MLCGSHLHWKLFLQCKIHRGIYRLAMIFTFTGKYPLILLVYCHHINLRITVKIIQPIRADTGRGKGYCTVFAEFCKDVLADVLISKRHKFSNEVLLNLVQNDLHIVQFQLALVRIHIPKPEADKVVCDEVQTFSGFLWVLFGDGRPFSMKPSSESVDR